MVKQYFATPASSAGVERVFSAAGKMHSDLQKEVRQGRDAGALALCGVQYRQIQYSTIYIYCSFGIVSVTDIINYSIGTGC